jgi:NAD(P)H-flavin reductase
MNKPIKTKATISNINTLTPDVKEFVLKCENEISFKAGQFVTLIFFDKNSNTTIRRAYSIASKPNEKNKTISLCIKLVEHGELTPKLWELKQGDTVEIMGGLGLFQGEKATKEKILLLGAGTGIAPLRSILLDTLEKDPNKPITLIYGVRHIHTHCYENEFIELEKKHPNFAYIPILSKPPKEWKGKIGHVQNHITKELCENTSIFICGLPQMVEGCVESIKKLECKNAEVFFEKY